MKRSSKQEGMIDFLVESRAEILAFVDAAEAALARGEGRVITRESMRDLAAEIKQRGRTRLAAELQAPKA
jgi:hypothetical protein